MAEGAFVEFGLEIRGRDRGIILKPSAAKDPTKIWIGNYEGEGGDFNAGELMIVIERFFNEKF
jgi:hypothetical protein